NLIEEWLLSNDFNEKYKKENHPYPSLLDPKKLNDEKEEINYKTIPAELAWEMNLPLPDNYEFVFLLIHGAGTTAMTRYLRLCNISLNRHWGDPVFQYLDSYRMLIKKSNYNVIILAGCLSKANFNLGIKFYNLIQKKIPAICVVRDPISVLRPIVNHYGNLQHPKDKIQSQIDIEKYPVQDNFKIQVPYAYPDQNGNPTLNTVKEYADDKYGDFYILSVKIKELKHRIQKLYYLDMNSILPENSFETLLNLSKIFHFTVPKSSELFFSKANSSDNHVDYLFFPKKLYLRYNNEDISLEIIKQKIVSSEYLDYTKYFTNSPFLIQEIGIKIILHKKYLQYFRSGIVYEKFSSYLHDYLFYLEQFYNKERKKIINEQEILDFMKSNPEVLKKYKLKLDKELVHIKEHRPDIVASWKYYQEFEKMCEELD
ncbi:DUF2972 domain-containing protein, partial [Campylobacter molothri]|uniref:DUF2972 domain-containing protein n=1 Tax=Campylobacter molothri TaxID=1032242 RepID=UPI0035B053E8